VARTPAFAWLRNLHRTAGQPSPSAQPVDLTRRALLLRLGATAGLLAVPRVWARARASGKVLVVGGGLAGLTCAWRLVQAGLDVTVIEAQDRCGGRARSLRGERIGGGVAELGGELVDRDHRHIQRLVEALNRDRRKNEAPLAWDRIRAFDARHELRDDVVWAAGALRSPKEITREMAKIAAHVQADAAARDKDRTARRSWQALDETSVAQYLDGLGQLADRPAPWLIELLSAAWTAEYGLDAKDQSALNFVSMFGDFYDNGQVRWQDEEVECLHLRGGNDQIVSRLAHRVSASGRIELGTRLMALRARSGGGWLATVAHAGGRRDIPADAVVLALPFSRLREADLRGVTLSPAKRRAIAELGYGTNTKVMTALRGQPWRERGLSGASMGDCRLGLTWDSSRPDETAARNAPRTGVLTQFRGGIEAIRACAQQDTASADAALAAVAALWQAATPEAGPFGVPALSGRRIAAPVYADWPKSDVAYGSYACYRSGQWSACEGAEGAREPGAPRLVFCGEHTSQVAQGFLEGAVESGDRAAAELLGDGRDG
jgi:monoamine oxidase